MCNSLDHTIEKIISRLTFPDDSDPEAGIFEHCFVASVTNDVLFKLVMPKFFI